MVTKILEILSCSFVHFITSSTACLFLRINHKRRFQVTFHACPQEHKTHTSIELSVKKHNHNLLISDIKKLVLVHFADGSRRSQEPEASPQSGSPIGICMISQNVVTASDQFLINASQELIRLCRAQDALQRVATDLSDTLSARLQKKGKQGPNYLWRVHLIGPTSAKKTEPN